MAQNSENETKAKKQSWWKRNYKKILVGGGIAVVAIVGGYFGYKCRDDIIKYSNDAINGVRDLLSNFKNRKKVVSTSTVSIIKDEASLDVSLKPVSAGAPKVVSKFSHSVYPVESISEASKSAIPAATQELDPDNCIIIMVPEYLRKLPEGYKASDRARILAEDIGLELPDGKTFVSAYEYTKCF